MRNKLFLMGMLTLVFMLMVIGCDNSTTNEEITSRSITITGILDDKNWAYARIGILSSLEESYYLAVTPFVPILNGKTTGELKLINDDHSVSDIAWNEGGEYYIEMLLSMVENGHGQRALYLYTNGADVDENNIPKHDINNATTSISFGAFKKTDEAE